MKLPEPTVGSVIRYSYLLHDEAHDELAMLRMAANDIVGPHAHWLPRASDRRTIRLSAP